MRKFTQIKEELDNKKFFQAKAEITLQVEAENEGEAGYLFDSILGGIAEQTDFNLANIEEISQMSERYSLLGIDKDQSKTPSISSLRNSKKSPASIKTQLESEGFDAAEINKILSIVFDDREL